MDDIAIRKTEPAQKPELAWDEDERKEIEGRILALPAPAIGALAKILVGFDDEDIADVVSDVIKNGVQSGHLPIILEEAESKEKVRWWVAYFEEGLVK